MERRKFLKCSLATPLTSLDAVEGGTKEVIYLPPEKAFIKHKDTWFLSIADIIKWCPIEYEGYDNGKLVRVPEGYLPAKDWSSFILPGPTDQFDFWREKEGHLFWVGKCTEWEICCDDGFLSFQLNSYARNSVKSGGKTPSG